MNLQTTIQKRSHLEEDQESKLIVVQTKLQTNKPIKLQRNLQLTLLLSCQNTKNRGSSRESQEDDEK